MVAIVAVHAIGQSTWPTPKSPRRVAVLEFRRTRDYIEPALGWAVAGIFALTAATLSWLFFAPDSSPLPASSSARVVNRFRPSTDARPDMSSPRHWVLDFFFSPSVLFLVMRLIASRRSLENLTLEQNNTLRTIGMNRLLRVSATVASGLAAIAGNYLSQPAPDSTTSSWVNWLAIVNMLALIAMLFWKPPFLDSPRTTPDTTLCSTPGGLWPLLQETAPPRPN
ncbi:hypothetical protein NHF46_18730 [Arthrobacter alpinus]|nr:hypothetical protein [Arthrobacter alpinus]